MIVISDSMMLYHLIQKVCCRVLSARLVTQFIMVYTFLFSAYKTVSGVNGPLVILDDVKVTGVSEHQTMNLIVQEYVSHWSLLEAGVQFPMSA